MAAFRVSKSIDFCYGHRLLDYEGKCRHLHGHNGRVEIELEGDRLDSRGMVVDFGDIKKGMKRWIDDNLDHRMILRSDDPSDFSSASCLSDPIPDDTTVDDAEVLLVRGDAFFYLIRATNGCPSPDDKGPLGDGSDGTPRTGSSCP